MKIRTKIILLSSAIASLILLSFAVYVSYFTSKTLENKFFKRLEENARMLGTHVMNSKVYKDKSYYELSNKFINQFSFGRNYLVRVEKDRKQPRYEPLLPMGNDFFEETIEHGRAELMLDGTAYVALFFEDKDHKKNLVVVSAAIDDFGNAEHRDLNEALISGVAIFLLFIILLSFYFADKLLNPIASINKRIGQINISNLNLRLPAKGAKEKDEIEVLISNINDMLSRLEISVKSQRSFISNASHSLRTPMTIISGESELALDCLDPEHPAHYSVEMVSKEVDRMNMIVNSLLLLSRTGYGGKDQNMSLVRIDELLYSVKESEGYLNDNHRIFLDFSNIPEDSNLLTVNVNQDLFFIGLSNIISNACKYGNEQEVKVGIAVVDSKIVIRVIDRGIGIPDRDKPHIFESFFRASNIGNIYGNGLGLVLARNIFELHHASLDIHSIEGVGTTVTIYCPIARL
ncbi:sensor histidine kinase [Pedobacter sp. KBW06]|uniref:sensor histidine kinase n=1 Tax=Pedobacter sp. KBW06 TaxID=2153359 RepID=UPI000F59BD70|nr:HAMP domain-containing sensor histidine kinase [Pedobacter sp. KBW06]RQO64896.1 sensor histidine kinase [Pedobacter sp. KBW06]